MNNTGTYTSKPTTLTKEMIQEAVSKLKYDPLGDFAKEKGFDLDAGDHIVLPLQVKTRFEARKGVKFSQYCDGAFLVRDVFDLNGWQKAKIQKFISD